MISTKSHFPQSDYFNGHLKTLIVVLIAALVALLFFQVAAAVISEHSAANRISPAPVSISSISTVPSLQSTAVATRGELKEAFGRALLLVLIVAVGFVCATYSVFGTNGFHSIWEKRKYIPSQYLKAHYQIMKDLRSEGSGYLPLGTRCEWAPWVPWTQKQIALPAKIRDKEPHMLVLGMSRKGKTRYIANLITQDIENNDRAIVVIDSNGALVEMLLRWVAVHPHADSISDRIVYIDPTDAASTFSYNPLKMPKNGDIQGAAKAVVEGFKAIYTENPGKQSQFDAQTANILRNAALLLIINGKTLADLPSLLQDNDFRDELLDNVAKSKIKNAEYISLLDAWKQYKKLARSEQWITWVEPILNRLGGILSDARLNPLFANLESDLNFTDVLSGKKIVLVKLDKGRLDANASLFGSLIVTGLRQASIALSEKTKSRPSSLYLDEFDKFVGQEILDSITRETQRYQIGLIGSMKTLQMLPEDFRNQLTVSVGTVICFSLLKSDAELFGPQMFRVDGRKIKFQTISNFFNPINSSPQFEYISDEALLNVHRLMAQNERHFFCYRVGTQAGVFHLKSHQINDVKDCDINRRIINRIKQNKATAITTG